MKSAELIVCNPGFFELSIVKVDSQKFYHRIIGRSAKTAKENVNLKGEEKGDRGIILNELRREVLDAIERVEAAIILDETVLTREVLFSMLHELEKGSFTKSSTVNVKASQFMRCVAAK